MKRAIILSVMAMFLTAVPAFAMESGDSKDHEKTFEQRKEGVLKMLDKRISVLQEEKACVTNAKTKDDLMACSRRVGNAHQNADHERWAMPTLRC